MSERPPRTESEMVEFVRSIDAQAPADLHRRIEALVEERSPRGRGRPLRAPTFGGLPSLDWRIGGAIAIFAIAALALVLGLSGGGSAALDVREASSPTVRPATMPAPAENPRRPTELAAAVDGVAFPYWKDRIGWRSIGARTDRVGGRAATVVFYANGRGQRIGYAIVAGSPSPRIRGGVVVRRSGTPYRLLTAGDLHVVTWVREDHLCVIAGTGVSSATLLGLASLNDRGAVA